MSGCDEVVKRVDLTTEALSGLEFAHEQADLLLDALTRAIHRSNATMSAESSVHTTPQKESESLDFASGESNLRRTGTATGIGRKLFDWGQGSEYLRSPFGRRRDAADEREALVCLSNKLEDLQMALELPHVNFSKIDKARGELLELALRKVDVVVRERTVLEDVLYFSGLEEKRVEEEREEALEDAMLSSEGGSGKGGPSVGDLLIDYFDGRETAKATATATAATETAAATKANDAAASNEKLSRFNHQEHHLHHRSSLSPAKGQGVEPRKKGVVMEMVDKMEEESANSRRFDTRGRKSRRQGGGGRKATRHSPTSVLDGFRDSPSSSIDTLAAERETQRVMLDEALPAPGLEYRDSGAIHPSKLSVQPVVAPESTAKSEAKKAKSLTGECAIEVKEETEEGHLHRAESDKEGRRKRKGGPATFLRMGLLLGGLAYCQAITSNNPKIFEVSSKFIQSKIAPHVGNFLQRVGDSVKRHVRPQRVVKSLGNVVIAATHLNQKKNNKKKRNATATSTKPKTAATLAELPTMSVSERSVIQAWAQSSFGKG